MRFLRASIGFACLALLALCLAASFRPREIRARLAASEDRGFGFDSRYKTFLEAIRSATPETATVAVFAPATSELYFSEAAYQLAPRRVVGQEHFADAQFLAVYRRGAAPALPAAATSVPGGFLLKR